ARWAAHPRDVRVRRHRVRRLVLASHRSRSNAFSMALAEPVGERGRFLALGLLALTLALVYGIWYSYGVIMVALLGEFGWSRSLLAGAFSLFTLVHGAANPLVGWLCGRIDPPRLVVAGSVALATALWLDSLI